MNVLFMTISSVETVEKHSISLDLLREFKRQGHEIYIVAGLERTNKADVFMPPCK